MLNVKNTIMTLGLVQLLDVFACLYFTKSETSQQSFVKVPVEVSPPVIPEEFGRRFGNQEAAKVTLDANNVVTLNGEVISKTDLPNLLRGQRTVDLSVDGSCEYGAMSELYEMASLAQTKHVNLILKSGGLK